MIKQLLNIALLIATANTISAQNYSGGSGTLADPYKIANKADLKYLSDSSSQWSYHFIQTADIMFSSTDFASGGDFYYGGQGFSPIGNLTTQFFGTYNGNNKLIDSLYINRPSQSYIGLFGYTNDFAASVSNLACTNVNINGYDRIGGLVGQNYAGSISNCYTSGTVNGTGSAVGGLVGYNLYYGSINNCHSSGTVSGSDMIGGLAGANDGDISNSYSSVVINGSSTKVGGLVGNFDLGTIINCYSTGTISGSDYTGGLVGYNDMGDIKYSHCDGAVTGNDNVGGLVGYNNSASIIISNCYNTAHVRGYSYVGGLTGYSTGIITKCYNIGIVESFSGMHQGGLVAWNGNLGIIYYCFNSGPVSPVSGLGTTNVGGLVGYNEGGINNSYSNGGVGGLNNVGGFVGQNIASIDKCYSNGSCVGFMTEGGFVGLNNGGSVINSFWDMQTSTLGGSDGGIGLNTAQMQIQSTYTGAGWDFVTDIWTFGTCNVDGSSYPIFKWQIFSGGGEGTVTNPFAIATKQDLKTLSENSCLWNKNFVQTADISFSPSDFTSGGAFYNAGQAFLSIGNSSTQFTGSYNGQNHKIENLQMNGNSYTGLFGHCFNANLTNLDVKNITVNSNYASAALCGYCISSNISTCSTSGNITSGYSSAGLVANSSSNTISNCYSLANVGVVVLRMGQNFDNVNLIDISGTSGTGGLIGSCNSSTITNCYAAGNVNTTIGQGGLIGVGTGNSVVNCFWDVQTSGQSISAGGNGRPTNEMKSDSTYLNHAWDFTGETTNGTNDYWTMGNCANNSGYPVFTWQILNPVPTISGAISLTNVSCYGNNDGTIDVTAGGGSSPYTFVWSNSATTEDIMQLGAGTYTVTITDVNMCTGTQTVSISEPAALDITTNTNSITITANATGVSYQWIDCGNANAEIAGETNQSFTATTNGNYAVVVTNGACSDTSACVAITTVGINSEFLNPNSALKIYPNPTSGIFIVAGFETGTKLEVVNVIGEVVYNCFTTDTKTKIDLSNESNGVYFIKTTNGYTYKIVKQN